MRRGIPALALLAAIATAAGANTPSKIEPLVGQYTTYKVQKGDTLYQIARRHDVGAAMLARMNHLKRPRVRPGQTLRMPTLHILPANPGTGIVLNIPERAVYVFKGGKLVERHAAAVGQPDWQTAQGAFKLRDKVANPAWKPTRDMVAREGIKDDIVPAGPENPVGDRWMGWSARGFGFHSTNAPRSIGSAASHGCVRLYPESARMMFETVAVGMPILSVYEPVKVGERDGKFYLSVFPDIYHTGETSLAHVKEVLDHRGLGSLVDDKTLQPIVRAADGFPHRIVGVDEPVLVNGQPIKSPIAPTRVRGSWMLPARELARGIDATVTTQPNGSVEFSAGGHILSLTPGQATATADGEEITLAVAPTVLKGTLIAPLQPFVRLFGAKVAYQKGKALTITSAPPTAPSRIGRRWL